MHVVTDEKDINGFPGGNFIVVSSPFTYAGMRTLCVKITGPVEEMAKNLIQYYHENRALLNMDYVSDNLAGERGKLQERDVQKTIDDMRSKLFEQIKNHNQDLLGTNPGDTLLQRLAYKAGNLLHQSKNRNEIVDEVLFQVARVRRPEDANTVIELIKTRQEKQGRLAAFYARPGDDEDRGI